MKRPALELGEMLEEDCYESSDILGAVLGGVLHVAPILSDSMHSMKTYGVFAVVGVRVANSHGLIVIGGQKAL